MAHKKLRLSNRKQQWADQFKPKKLTGSVLSVSVGIEARYAAEMTKAIDQMHKETVKAIRDLFNTDDYAGAYGMDANIGSQARITINGLTDRFTALFGKIANPISQKMTDQVDKNSASTLKESLRDIAGHMSFKTDILNDELRETLTAATAESANLIKRVPAKYLDNIGSAVFRAIATGKGLADVLPVMEKQKVTVKNWAKNVAMDQTRKAYNGLTAGRMDALGVKKYEWVHSGGSHEPRPYHRDVLNGQIFCLDDPPVIDLKTGERGKPGDTYFCRCKMRPIVSFDE